MMDSVASGTHFTWGSKAYLLHSSSQQLRRSGSGRRYDLHGNSANINRARPFIRLESEVQKSIFKLDSNVYFPPLLGWQSISGSSYGGGEFATPRCLSLANKLQLFVLNTRRFFTGLRTRPQNNQVTLKRISLAFRSLLKRREVNSQFSKINTVEQQLLAQLSGVINASFCLNLPFKCGLYCWRWNFG